jgi:hypothetical protein
MYESNILGTVYGSVSNQRICKITTNQELTELSKISDFAADNKRRRMAWLVNLPKTEQKKKGFLRRILNVSEETEEQRQSPD